MIEEKRSGVRIRRRSEELEKILLEWEGSGLSRVAFCKKKGISPYLFRKHRSMIREEVEAEEAVLGSGTDFIKLPLFSDHSIHGSGDIEIKNASGLCVKLSCQVPREILMCVIRELSR